MEVDSHKNARLLKGTKLPDHRVGQSDHTMFCYTYVYWLTRSELTAVEGDMILWGVRVVVPAKLRVRNDELWQEHP